MADFLNGEIVAPLSDWQVTKLIALAAVATYIMRALHRRPA
jgi:hypothetical protein